MYGRASYRSRLHSVCGRLGGSLGGMPLAGSLPDWDADGSRYSTRPARLVHWLFERLLLGCKAHVVGVDETVGGN